MMRFKSLFAERGDVVKKLADGSVQLKTGGVVVTFKPVADNVLGSGGFSTVYNGAAEVAGGKAEECAVKVISKKAFNKKEDLEDMLREVAIMERLRGHPNVVSLICHYNGSEDFIVVMSKAVGGDVMTRVEELVSKGYHFSERVASRMFRQMLLAVKHCHDNNVIHRDLKPENFLYTRKLEARDSGEGVPIQLTDFGLSAILDKPDALLTDGCGSAFYIAPEIITYTSDVPGSGVPGPNRDGVRDKRDVPIGYSKPVDVFALGVILHIFLSGQVPFGGGTKKESDIFHSIRFDPLTFGPTWSAITPAAKELITGCLDKDPLKRYTVDQALAHPWVAGEAAPDVKLEGKVLECLQAFSSANKFKRAAVGLVAKMLTADDVRGLRETFMKMDKDGSGTLTTVEVREALREVAGAKGVDPEAMMAAIDADGDGTVNWEEFLHASMEAQMVHFQRQIWEAFCELDVDGSGTITVDELRTVLKGESEAQIARYMDEYDLDKDGTINYEEFLRMLLPKTLKYKVKRTDDAGAASGGAGGGGGR